MGTSRGSARLRRRLCQEYGQHPHRGAPPQADGLVAVYGDQLSMATTCSRSAAQRCGGLSIDTTPEPPSAPSTPEQPTRSISRLTPSDHRSRELLDTIKPRALWATDTRRMAQEKALLIVEVNDASVMCEVMTEVLAVRGLVAALADWKQRLAPVVYSCGWQAHWMTPLQRRVAEKRVRQQDNTQHGEGQHHSAANRQPPQQATAADKQPQLPQRTAQTRREQQQQDYTKKAADMQQHQRQWSPRPKPRQQENMHKEYLERFEKHVGQSSGRKSSTYL